MTSVHLGVDAQLGSAALGGLMVSYSDTDIDDYTHAVGGVSRAGDYALQVTSVSPYLGWRGAAGMEAWAMASYGSGDLEVTWAGERLSSDVKLRTLGVGASGALARVGGREVRLRAEGFATRAEVQGGGAGAAVAGIPAADVNANRLRLMLHSSATHALSSGARLSPSGELGMRYDSGDGRSGGGVELGGAVRYEHAPRGLSVEGRVRGLLSHSANYDDGGVSMSGKWAAGADGQGWSWSLNPAYGNTAGGLQEIWDQGLPGDDNNDDQGLHGRVQMRAGYGVKGWSDTGLVTPYSEMSSGRDKRSYRLGVQWQINQRLDFDASALRTHENDKASQDAFTIKAELRF